MARPARRAALPPSLRHSARAAARAYARRAPPPEPSRHPQAALCSFPGSSDSASVPPPRMGGASLKKATAVGPHRTQLIKILGVPTEGELEEGRKRPRGADVVPKRFFLLSHTQCSAELSSLRKRSKSAGQETGASPCLALNVQCEDPHNPYQCLSIWGGDEVGRMTESSVVGGETRGMSGWGRGRDKASSQPSCFCL